MAARYSDSSVLYYVGSEIERMGEELDASEETMRDAIRLCGDVLRSGYEYSSVDCIASSCLYLACQRNDEPISLPDVSDQSRKSKKRVQHLSANLMAELDIQMTPEEPDSYLEKGIEEFEFSDAQASECYELLERGKRQNLHSGVAPTTVAGAILYAVAKKHRLNIRQKDVAECVNKTEVSIRNMYREFLKLADDVPVDVLPPQTVTDAIATLQSGFTDHPDTYVEETKRVIDSTEIGNGVSRAGIVGGTYLTVARAHGEDILPAEISSVIGVGPQTIVTHSGEIQYDK